MFRQRGSRILAFQGVRRIAVVLTVGVMAAGCGAAGGSVTVSTVTVTATVTVTTDRADDPNSDPTAAGAVFDATEVAAGVEQILTGEPPDGYGLNGVTTVVCPAGQPITKGTTFDCSAMIDGAVKSVPVTVTGDENDPAERGSYQVGIPQ